MKRLTKKIKVRGKETYRINPSLQHRGEVKLGKLEDIEEELGIELITLLKALIDDKVYVKWRNKGILMKGICLRNDLRPMRLDYTSVEYPNYGNKCLLKDYGKTWAFTKEELE